MPHCQCSQCIFFINHIRWKRSWWTLSPLQTGKKVSCFKWQYSHCSERHSGSTKNSIHIKLTSKRKTNRKLTHPVDLIKFSERWILNSVQLLQAGRRCYLRVFMLVGESPQFPWERCLRHRAAHPKRMLMTVTTSRKKPLPEGDSLKMKSHCSIQQ